jgi:hypothetical protein
MTVYTSRNEKVPSRESHEIAKKTPKSIRIPCDENSAKSQYLYLTLESPQEITVKVRAIFGKPKRTDKFLLSLMNQKEVFTGKTVMK